MACNCWSLFNRLFKKKAGGEKNGLEYDASDSMLRLILALCVIFIRRCQFKSDNELHETTGKYKREINPNQLKALIHSIKINESFQA